YIFIPYFDGDLVALVRIDDGAGIAAVASDFLGQVASLTRIGAFILLTIQDECGCLDVSCVIQDRTYPKRIVTSARLSAHRIYHGRLHRAELRIHNEPGQLEQAQKENDTRARAIRTRDEARHDRTATDAFDDDPAGGHVPIRPELRDDARYSMLGE